jgi:DNA-binding CsgD family transcriptional regulator/tetratricopeptide (TPR) repeat protein
MTNDAPELQIARDAMRRGAWQEAVEAFRAVVETQPGNAAALEGLGTALWWLDDHDPVLQARERAFRAYREAGDALGAARVAAALSIDYGDYRGDVAVADGWMQRAERLLQGAPPSPELGWVKLTHGFIDLMFHNNLEGANAFAAEGTAIAETLQNFDLQMMSLCIQGLIMVREGRAGEGMRRIDEMMAAATAGEMTDLTMVSNACCTLLYACEAIADYDRANQWCEQTMEFCRRTGLDTLFTVCRTHYASVLIWQGQWDAAEAELTSAVRELAPGRSDYVRQSLAKLGEVRRRQGRFDEAEALFGRAEPHFIALRGRAALALDRDDVESALDYAGRFLRRVGVEDQAEQAFAHHLLVRGYLRKGDLDAAERHLADLHDTAALVGTKPLLAIASESNGAFAVAEQRLDDAKRCLEDAIDLYETTADAFDAARTRLAYAEVLSSLGREAPALEQAVLAGETFKRLGAAHYAGVAQTLVAKLSGPLGAHPVTTSLPNGLSAREVEVLWLLAAGKTNQEIADGLVLSVRTVERHISTIYQKLEIKGRAARASAAAFAMSMQA